MSGSLSSAEGELNAIVKEYLEISKLEDSLLAFEEECQKKGKPIQENAGKNKRDEKVQKVQRELLNHFDLGKRLEFFSTWEAHINPEVRDRDPYCQKLEFMLHVHFAVFPLRKKDHWIQEEVEEAMFHFRYYLETRGSFLSSSPDLLPFYALPYVQTPSSHPSFEEVFRDTWTTEIRNKLETFVWEDLKRKWNQDQVMPRLVDLYNKNDFDLIESQNEAKSLERRLDESEKRYIGQSKKLDKLQEDCHQLMSVASLLVTALESALRGDIVDLDYVLSSCAERFPEAYKLKETVQTSQSLSSVAEDPVTALLSSGILPSSEDLNPSQAAPVEFHLDFPKIKSTLCGTDERQQLLLLQALRWRLTKADSWDNKEKSISNFIKHDVLTLKDVSTKQPTFVHTMRTFSVIHRQSIARFLNAFASFSKGRAYLSQCPELLEALMDNLLVFKSKDSIIKDMTLGALQKLSMRNICQTIMIEAGMMEWLSDTLNNSKILSDYGLEYGAALLMNLCLCPQGKIKSEQIKEKLFFVLRNLLHLEKKNVTEYVNGALYSILSIPGIKQYANQQHFEDTLLRMMKKSEPEVKKQLECIQELLHTDGADICSSEEDVEDDEETELEMELEADDPVNALPGEVSGELLLWKNYAFDLPSNLYLKASKVQSNDDPNREPRPGIDIQDNDQELEDNIKDILTPVRRHTLNLVGGAASDGLSIRSNSVPLNGQMHSPSKTIGLSDGNYSLSEPVTPKLDLEATQLVRKIVGQPSTTLVEAVMLPNPASVNIKGLNVNEYMVAFSSRPKIPRTPELMSPSSSKRSKNPSTPNTTMLRTMSRESNSAMDYCRMSPKVSASSPPPSPHLRDLSGERKLLHTRGLEAERSF